MRDYTKQIKWTPDKIKFLKDTYPTKGSFPCVKKFKISRHAVKSMARLLKVKCLKDKNLYKLKILNEETLLSYYWLGFIVADGFISEGGQMSFILSIIDKNHLNKLAKLIGIKLHTRTVKTAYATSKICSISCKDVKYGIIIKNKLNITNNKTYNAPNLNFFKNKEQALAFFIGFSDGDGMIQWRHDVPSMLRINCHYNWINNFKIFKYYMKKNGINTSVVRVDKRGYSVFSISTGSDILKIRQWAMNNNIPLLTRKWFTRNKQGRYKTKINNKYNEILMLIENGKTYKQISKILKREFKYIYQYIYTHKELYILYNTK